MPLMLELQETVERLDNNSRSLLLEIAKKFLSSTDSNEEEEELTDQDLYFISLAEEEYANGETTSHEDIDWD